VSVVFLDYYESERPQHRIENSDEFEITKKESKERKINCRLDLGCSRISMAGDLSLAEYSKLKKGMTETPKVGRQCSKKDKRGKVHFHSVVPARICRNHGGCESSGAGQDGVG